MIIGKDYIFIHLHKCGGTQVSNVLEKHYEGVFLKGKHSKLTLEEFKLYKANGFKIVGAIRNPYAWYVSLWAFVCSGKGALLNSIKSINKNIMELYNNNNSVSNFGKWLKFVMNKYHHDNKEGLLTKQLKDMYYINGELIVDSFLHTESLSDDLCEILGEKDGVREQMEERVFSSVHMPYERYYTPELKQLVEKKDAFTFQLLDHA